MPNVNGPRSSKRELPMAAAMSMALYAAPIWRTVIDKAKYRKMIG